MGASLMTLLVRLECPLDRMNESDSTLNRKAPHGSVGRLSF